MLIVDMLSFALDNPAPAVVMLISGDREFVYALSILRHRRYTVVLITPPEGAYITLKAQANVVLDWTFDIFADSDAQNVGIATPPPQTRKIPITPSDGATGWSPWRPKYSGQTSPTPSPRGRALSFTSPPTRVPTTRAPDATRPEPADGENAARGLFTFGDFINPQEVTEDANETPGSITPVADATVVSLQSPDGPSAPGLPAPRSDEQPTGPLNRGDADPTREFGNLIEILERLRLMGKDRPQWTQVGDELRKQNPMIYQRLGVK